MKTNIIKVIFSIFILLIISNSCVQDGDFEIPNLEIEDPNIIVNSDITAIKSALIQRFNTSGDLVNTFFKNEDNPTYVEGYVISSDAAGNFFKTLIIQDKPTNPTAGIEINLNDSSLSESYQIGQKIIIKLDGLSVSYDDGGNDANNNPNDDVDPTNDVPGKYVLGILNGNRVEDIPSTQIKENIFRTSTIEEVIPKSISIAAISGNDVNTYIQLPNAQFIKSDINKTFAGEANDSFDGFRTIFECETREKLQLQSSTFSSFKSNIIPAKKGAINAVLSKDFASEFLVAIINTPSDITFTDDNRCDPPVLECNSATSIGGTTIVYEEDFKTITNNIALMNAGFTNVNINGGNTIFSTKSFRGNRYVEIAGFNSGENPLDAWLVTPAINLDNSINEELTFFTNTGFNNGIALTAFVSSDFSGDVTTATWVELDAILADGPRNGFGNFTSSGSIDLSCLSGYIYIGFRYIGADGGVTTTFQIDDIKVSGN